MKSSCRDPIGKKYFNVKRSLKCGDVIGTN